MPAAAPLPRHPGVLTMDGPAALLTAPGCPVCRYVGEASDRNLTWFALEGHADSTAIGRLAASLGPCPRHTRRLMSQPGAPVRLTAVYPYILRAARKRLTGHRTPVPDCPMCEHEAAAAARALETLLEGFADELVRERCRQLGGLCVPHLRAASSRRHMLTGWLAETMTVTLLARPSRIQWVAGDFDHDAEVRSVLGRAIPGRSLPGSYVCLACLAGTHAERIVLTRLATRSGEDLPDDAVLCASHLGDVANATGEQALRPLLAWQANSQLGAAAPARTIFRWPLVKPGRPARPGCAACRAHEIAVRLALDDIRQGLRARPRASHAEMCIRHVVYLRTIDPWAAQMTTRTAIDQADAAVAELADAFRMNAARHGQAAVGPQLTAWRRAAAVLDGRVFCGSPPYPQQRAGPSSVP